MISIQERPILFSAPMVRAILEGRKTVTRRLVKPWQQPNLEEDGTWFAIAQRHARWGFGVSGVDAASCAAELARSGCCPYGRPGERLWMRETWGVISHDFDEQGNMVDWTPDRQATPIREMPFGRGYYSGHVIYRADGEAAWAGDDDGGGDDRSAWRPSIHMPRVASRILLEITDVRVERLQDISPAQCLSEGVQAFGGDGYHIEDGRFFTDHPYETFAGLWQSINGEESWHSNPWVWVVEFKRV
ncbi:hypothetical protein, partial [Pseudomonas sp. UBA5706]